MIGVISVTTPDPARLRRDLCAEFLDSVNVRGDDRLQTESSRTGRKIAVAFLKIVTAIRSIPHDDLKNRLRRFWLRLLLKFQRCQHILEALARVEDDAHIGDAVGGHFIRSIGTVARDADAEGAELAQFHDLSVRQLIRHNGQEGFEHRHRVGGADGGHAGDLFGDRVRIGSAGAFCHGIILGRGGLIAGVFLGCDRKRDGHGGILLLLG